MSLTVRHPVYRKISMHLLPILFISYLVNFLDRVNVGFAKISMLGSLGMSVEAFGFGTGLFFIGYFLFEVPSNLALYHFGARKWLARIVFSWGFFSSLTAFVHDEWHYFAIRFLLGVAEAGFFPGIILYLTWWYPSAMRAQIVASFLMAVAMAGVVGGPLSGWIMESFRNVWGWEDWRWMFLLEGVPCFAVGLWILYGLPDRPRNARWLSEEEKKVVEDDLVGEEELRRQHGAPRDALHSLRLPAVWKLCALYFFQTMALYGIAFWLPTIIEGCFATREPLKIGLLTVIPWGFAIVVMYAFGYSSDHFQERKWHAIAAALIGAMGMAYAGFGDNAWGDLSGLSFGAGGVMAIIAITWSYPAAILNGSAAAAGIAMINSIGNLGGFLNPILTAKLQVNTGNMNSGLYLMAASLLAAAIMLLVCRFSIKENI